MQCQVVTAADMPTGRAVNTSDVCVLTDDYIDAALHRHGARLALAGSPRPPLRPFFVTHDGHPRSASRAAQIVARYGGLMSPFAGRTKKGHTFGPDGTRSPYAQLPVGRMKKPPRVI